MPGPSIQTARIPRVLVVDDHHDILEPLADYLGSQGLSVSTAMSGAGMREVLAAQPVDLVVLDVMLPDDSGWVLCDEAVHKHGLPVILLTAMVEVDDRVRGLSLGADDYVVKPFAPAELLARIQTVLRRAARPGAAAGPAPSAAGLPAHPGAPAARYIFDGWTLDLGRFELRDRSGEVVGLNTAELKLLAAFVTHPNTVLPRERLLQLTHGDQTPGVFDRSIDTVVSRLRKKLEARAHGQRMIKTAWGDGYLFAVEVRSE